MIGIIDYSMGNLMSVSNALDYLKIENTIIEDPDKIKSISHLIIPGVGSFPHAIEMIKKKEFFESIVEFAKVGNPVLGVCLGMQLLANRGEEGTPTDGLGLIPGVVTKLKTDYHLPHVGWNGLHKKREHPITAGVKNESDVYFVHSYCFECIHDKNILSTTEYGISFNSMITNDEGNVVGVQFHPEKSQRQGLRILTNFSEM